MARATERMECDGDTSGFAVVINSLYDHFNQSDSISKCHRFPDRVKRKDCRFDFVVVMGTRIDLC